VPNQANVRTDDAPSRYELAAAILLYRAGNDTYATLHEVETHRKGGPMLGAGVPATTEACADFARSIAERSAFAGFTEPRMLYVGPRVMAWWRAPAPARVWFESDRDDGKKLIGTRTAITPHPGLVFAIAHGEWYVWAVKGDKRPTPDTRVWFAPYFNVYHDGHICEGNVQRPDRVTPDTVAAFERAFFESKFTHPNVQRAREFCAMKGGAYAFWRALLDGRFKQFPDQHLVAVAGRGKTLAERIRQLEDSKHERD
jgi:PRTRC genetic system protein B